MSDESETSVVRTIGRYHAIDELGRGAMGIVYRGFDPVIGRAVALKTIGFASEDAEAAQLRQRLYREASAAGTLTHSNIVTIYDVIEDGATTAVAMELVEGQTLASALSASGPLPLDRALEIFEQICSALDYAGSKGIVHRDIKPANILMTPDGRPKVTDFGIARLSAPGLTQTGTIMGSPSYMSPEQVRGLALDPRSDLFSAAVVFYEMLTGERPFGGDDVATTMYRIVNEPPRALEHLNPSVNPAVSGIMQRALEKNPAARFQTGADLVAELRRAIGISGMDSFASFLPAAVPAPAPAKKRSRMLLYGGLGAVFLIVLLILGGQSGQTGTETQNQVQQTTVPVQPGAVAPPPATKSESAPPVSVPGAGAPFPEQTTPSYAGPVSTMPPPVGAAGGSATAPSGTPGAMSGTSGAGAVDPLRNRPGASSPPPPSERGQPDRAATNVVDTAAVPTPRTAPRPQTPEREAPPPTAAPPVSPKPAAGDAVLRIDFAGTPYPVTLFDGGTRIGRVEGPDGSVVAVDPGTLQLRAVSEALFLDVDLGAVTVRPGERRTIPLPGVCSAVLSVKGEDYDGLRILIDGRQVAGPYPAQIQRLAAGSHRVTYRWVAGAAAGRELADTVAVSAGGHFLIRAVPDNAQIVVQQLR